MGHWDLDRLEKWTDRNVFNEGKCKVLILGRNNPMHQFTLRTNWQRGSLEKDLKVLADTKSTVSQQCALATKNAHSLLGCVRESIASRSRKVIIPLYSALVRPHLECQIHFCASWYKRDVYILD